MKLDFDPELDLEFSRTTKLTPAQLWRGWTDPATITKWFCPKPWATVEALFA